MIDILQNVLTWFFIGDGSANLAFLPLIPIATSLAGGLLKGGEKAQPKEVPTTTTTSKSFLQADTNRLNRGIGGLESATGRFGQGIAGSQNRLGQDLANFRSGRLGVREQGQLSQGRQAQAKLQAQRDVANQALGKQGKILGRLGRLKGDLAQNQARFALGQQQRANLGATAQAESGLTGLGAQGLQAQTGLLNQSRQLADLRSTKTVDKKINRPKASLFDKLSRFAPGANKAAQLLKG